MEEKKKDEEVWLDGMTTSEMAKAITASILRLHESPEYKAMLKKTKKKRKPRQKKTPR
jgi:hypothetical protein